MRLISDAMHGDLGSPDTQTWLLAGLCQVLASQAGMLLLVNERRRELVIYHAAEAETYRDYRHELTAPGSFFQRCLELRKTAAFRVGELDCNLDFLRAAGGIEPEMLLCTPLLAGEHILGALAVANKQPSGYTTHDQDTLGRIAGSLAQSIHNARLIQQLKVANADLEVSHWQLLRSRNTLRALFDSIPTSIYIIDAKYNLAAINRHRADRTDTPPNVLVGRRCYEALYKRDDVCPDCRVLETLFEGKSTTRTRRLWVSDQEPQEWEISAYPIHDDVNQIVQAILLEQDVTERRRLESTLAQSEKLAAVGQLAAGLAHEINNPLTAIIANAQLLLRETPAEDDKQELIDLILRAGHRATQVVRSLLDLARKEKYEFVLTDINESLRKSLAFLQHEFITRSVNLVFEPATDLPKVMASQDHLQGVWLNLLTNALDALDSGPSEIRILTRLQGNEVRVMVSDSGKGIPPDRLSRIFEPFYTTKAPGRGTGLGLSVCHRVIKQHGGRILVDSQIGMGTQFTVILPIS